jgi:hypothetical protein
MFPIGNRVLGLYQHTSRPPSSAYSLYWEDGSGARGGDCVQHNMTAHEVFKVLGGLLREAK